MRSVVTKKILLGTQVWSSATDSFSATFHNVFMDVSLTVCLAGSFSWCTVRNSKQRLHLGAHCFCLFLWPHELVVHWKPLTIGLGLLMECLWLISSRFCSCSFKKFCSDVSSFHFLTLPLHFWHHLRSRRFLSFFFPVGILQGYSLSMFSIPVIMLVLILWSVPARFRTSYVCIGFSGFG